MRTAFKDMKNEKRLDRAVFRALGGKGWDGFTVALAIAWPLSGALKYNLQ